MEFGIPYGVLVVDEVRYTVLRPLKEVRTSGLDRMEFVAHGKEIVDKCECCGRFNMVEAVAHSVAEMIERGWLKVEV